jgi:protein TonB
MAFDAYRAQSRPHPRSGRRRLIYAASIALHAALIAGGVAYSFWHIDELTPPVVRVTFMASAPPPPPPPPPAGGGGAARKKPAVKPHVVPTKTPEIVQPRETPKPEPPKETPKPEEKTDEGEKAGEKGGVTGGVAGGTVGGTAQGTIGGKLGGTPGGIVGASGPPAKFLPPNMGAAQKLLGPDPPFPPSLRRAGVVYRVLAKICVGTSGAVEKITIMKGADPQLDEGVTSTVKSSWRFRPLMANAMPVPFCYPATFEFKSQ